VLNFEVIKALSSIVGMLGGFLGFFVFIDNYVLKFKPRLNISNTLFFRYKKKDENPYVNGRTLESVILKIEALNGRNKIGRIDDFAIRIYDSKATSPSGYMLFSENVLERLPRKISALNDNEITSFSPVSILGKSNTSFVVEFKPEKYISMILNPEGDLKLDLLYYLPKKGWKLVGTFLPYYFKRHDDKEDPNGVIEYSLLDNAVTRTEASKSLQKPKVGIYKGISGKYLGFYLMKPVWFLKRLATYPVKVFKLVYALFEVLVRQVLTHLIVFPLIKLKSKSLPRIQVKSAKAHLLEDTKLSLKQCRGYIEKIANKINAKADSRAKIIIEDSENGFSIHRGRLEVKFYKSGDGHIRANDIGGYPQMFTFAMELVEYPFGIRLWNVNNKVMTVKSACIHIMDSFVLLAH